MILRNKNTGELLKVYEKHTWEDGFVTNVSCTAVDKNGMIRKDFRNSAWVEEGPIDPHKNRLCSLWTSVRPRQ